MLGPYEFTGKASEDGLTITFEFSKGMKLTAPELEDFTRSLATIRAGFQPPVPMDPSLPTTLHSTVSADYWYVEPDPDAPTQVRLLVRHPGFGWIKLPLGPKNVAEMLEKVQTALRHLPKVQ